MIQNRQGTALWSAWRRIFVPLMAMSLGTACVSGPSTVPSPDGHASLTPLEQADADLIRDTLGRYAIYLDDGRVEEFVDLFTEDAVFTAAEFVYSGRDGIRRELAEKERRPGKHLPFPALIEFETTTRARAWSDFLRVKIEREGDPTSWEITSIGRYYDLLLRCEDGRWRIQRRDVHLPGMSNLVDLVEPRRN